MKYLGTLAILGAFIAASATLASATPITPGGGGGSVTPIAASSLGSLVTTYTGTLSASGGGYILDAPFTEWVYEGGTNALCPTCLAFGFKFTNSGTDDIQELSASSYLGFTTVADYVVPANATGSVGPFGVNETNQGTVDYVFMPNVLPGESSDEVVLFTDATNYTSGLISLQDNLTDFTTDLAPAVTPEPSSLLLLGTGLLGAAGIARRKFAAKFV